MIAPETYGEARTCAAPGCSTRLNRFNPNDRCYVHVAAQVTERASSYVKPDEREARRWRVLLCLPANIAQVAERAELTTDQARNCLEYLMRTGRVYRTGTPGGGPHRVGYVYRARDGAEGET